MPRGRPPTPVERKRLTGNPGKRRLPAPAPALPPVTAPPRAPAGLGNCGRAAWRRIWQQAPWLAASDGELLRLLCSTLDERTALLGDLRREGRTFVTDKGYRASHPALTELRKLDAQLTTWFGLLGLTASDRTRLGLAEVRRVSKLEELRERYQRPQPGDGAHDDVIDAELVGD